MTTNRLTFEHNGAAIYVDAKDGRFKATAITGETINAPSLQAAKKALGNAAAKFVPFDGYVLGYEIGAGRKVRRHRFTQSETRERHGRVVTEFFTEKGYRYRDVYAVTPENRRKLEAALKIARQRDAFEKKTQKMERELLASCERPMLKPAPRAQSSAGSEVKP